MKSYKFSRVESLIRGSAAESEILGIPCLQGVMVTDPALAMHVLYSPHFDKFEFAYSFLDPVSAGYLDTLKHIGHKLDHPSLN